MNEQIIELIHAEKYDEAIDAANNCFMNGDSDAAYEIYDEVYAIM